MEYSIQMYLRHTLVLKQFKYISTLAATFIGLSLSAYSAVVNV